MMGDSSNFSGLVSWEEGGRKGRGEEGGRRGREKWRDEVREGEMEEWREGRKEGSNATN